MQQPGDPFRLSVRPICIWADDVWQPSILSLASPPALQLFPPCSFSTALLFPSPCSRRCLRSLIYESVAGADCPGDGADQQGGGFGSQRSTSGRHSRSRGRRPRHSALASGFTVEPGVLEAGVALQHLDSAVGARVTASCEAFAAERKPAAGLLLISASLPGFARKFSRARRQASLASSTPAAEQRHVGLLLATVKAWHSGAHTGSVHTCRVVLRRSAKRSGARRMCYGDSGGKRCTDVSGHATRPCRASADAPVTSESYTTSWQRIALINASARCHPQQRSQHECW